jgi:hypothetical protein
MPVLMIFLYRAFDLRFMVSGGDRFGHCSAFLEFPEVYALDVDGPQEFALAEFMIASGVAELPRGLPAPADDIRPR